MRIHYTATVWHSGFYKYFADALKSLGHDVCFFNDGGSGVQENVRRILSRIPKIKYAATSMFCDAVSRSWLDSVKNYAPDLIILEHTNIVAKYIAEARKLKIPIFCWVDSPPAGAQSQAHEVLASLKLADKVFSVDRKWMTILYPPGSFVHLPLAGSPEVFYPQYGVKEDNKKYDVTYVGSLPPQSGSGYLRAAIAANVPEKFSVAVFGNGADYWVKYFPVLKKRVQAGNILDSARVNEIYNQSRIVLNIHAIGHISSLSARTYEIALAGAFQLVDWREDLDILTPDAFQTFKYAKDVNGMVEEWLGKPKERAEIAQKARETILGNHTWRHRAEKMLSYL